MKNKNISCEKILVQCFIVLCLFTFLFLFFISMDATWNNGSDLADEFVYLQPDSAGKNIGGILLSLCLGWLLYFAFEKFSHKWNMAIMAGVVCVIATLFSIYWVPASNTMPQADQ